MLAIGEKVIYKLKPNKVYVVEANKANPAFRSCTPNRLLATFQLPKNYDYILRLDVEEAEGGLPQYLWAFEFLVEKI